MLPTTHGGETIGGGARCRSAPRQAAMAVAAGGSGMCGAYTIAQIGRDEGGRVERSRWSALC